jgi:hypothetical protein
MTGMTVESWGGSTQTMQTSRPKSLTWPEVLAALRACTGDSVLVRDGRVTEPADVVRPRPAAKGTELCLFSGQKPAARTALIEGLETLEKGSGRRFMAAARASVNGSFLLVESVGDEDVDGKTIAIVRTRRPVLGYNQSQQTGSSTTFRNKRIKTN